MGNTKSKQAKLKRKADEDPRRIVETVFSAALAYSPEAMQHLLDSAEYSPSVIVNARNADLETALSCTRCPQVAALLLQHGADLNARNKYGRTPLHMVRNLEIATLLLARGADVNALDQFDETPLNAVVAYGSLDMVKVLIDAGADVKLTGQAVQSSTTEILRFLLDCGASVDRCVLTNETPLYVAAKSGRLEAVKLLLARGADVHGDAAREKVPLVGAAANGYIEVMGELLAYGATSQPPTTEEDASRSTNEGDSSSSTAPQSTVAMTGERPTMDATLDFCISNYNTSMPKGAFQTQQCCNTWLDKMAAMKMHDAAQVSNDLVRHLRSMTKELDSRVVSETYKKVGEFGQLVLRVWKWMLQYEAKSIVQRIVDSEATLREFAALHRAVYMLQAIFDSERAENLNYRALEAKLHQDWSTRLKYNRETREELTSFLAAEVQDCVNETDQRAVWRRMLVVALGLEILHGQGIAHGSLGVWSDGALKMVVAPEDSQVKKAPHASLSTPAQVRQGSQPSPSCAADIYVFGKGIMHTLMGGNPWGQVSQDVARVLSDAGRLPRRPEHIGVAQWRLLVEMQAVDLAKRVDISHVVSEMRKFVGGEDAEEAKVDLNP